MEDVKEETVEEVKKIAEVIKEPVIVPTEINEEFSEEIGQLALAMAKAQGAMTNGKKSKEGYGYNYMDLASLIDIMRQPLADNGLAVMRTHQLSRVGTLSVITRTTIAHESGQWFKSSIDIPIAIMKQLTSAQMMGIAATYGRRYSLQALSLIASEEDTDGTAKK